MSLGSRLSLYVSGGQQPVQPPPDPQIQSNTTRSTVMGSFISVAILSIPALGSFRKLAISMDKLSKVVSEEVPGTLSSLKLSSLEINDLTNQLKFLRQKIPRNKYGREPRATPRPRCKPIIN